jgi:para-aminobenzoate synthetase component 1
MDAQKTSLKEKIMQWASTHEVCCILDSNGYADPYSQYDCLVAVGVAAELSAPAGDAFTQLRTFYEKQQDWMFGFFSYELKNEVEILPSAHTDKLGFPDLYFFTPIYLIRIEGDSIRFLKGDNSILTTIEQFECSIHPPQKLTIQSRFDRSTYLQTVEKLREHIRRGDLYEVNFCQEFFAAHAAIAPFEVYKKLNALSPTPFAGYFRLYDRYILSATPERFLCKRGRQLISQPIKGTAKRNNDPVKDEEIKRQLKENAKEQAENVMIVDLVRNDLTKSAVPGTVKVEELFGIYTFPQVHQMISTISCELSPAVHFIDAIKNAFPMGSMTGAPKIKAMALIENYEKSKRGVFSGSFGCINPEGDFDFNVIIRSILYHATEQYLSFQVGGAITYAATAAEEYEECLLKASAIVKVLAG